MTALLKTLDLDVVVGDNTLVSKLNFEITPSDRICLLGANGSGKTSTLHTIAGLRQAKPRSVYIKDKDLDNLPRKEVAQTLGLLLQTHEDSFPTSVLETCLVGRHPHIDFWSWESATDIQYAKDSLEQMHLAQFVDRSVDSLSGGERQRLAIAAILTQRPDILLLDEPTNHLDPPHQLLVLSLLKKLAENGKGILASFHDINLAASICNKALLLFGDGSWTFGDANEILTTENLSRLYATKFREIRDQNDRWFIPYSHQ